jgi:serine/threonine-protein kinase RsbW
MAAKTSVKLVIPSEIRLIDLVHVASEKLAEVVGFDPDEALNLGLAVREAVINAMLHGNRKDPNLEVTITLASDRGRFVAKVADQGNGFDPESAPDPTDRENLLRNSGRGLLLMEAFVDTVKFRSLSGGGTQVTLVKRLPKTNGNANDNAS